MVIKDTINTDKYLYIKKLTCMLGLTRLQRCIEINNEKLSEEDIKKELLDEVASLSRNITIPAFTIRTNTSFINMEDIYYATIEIIESPEQPKNASFWVHRKKITQISQRDIYNLPNKEAAFAELYRDYQYRKLPYDNIRSFVVKIINSIDYMFSIINTYINDNATSITIPTVIFYLNTIEFIDWIFSLSEFGESIFSDYSIPEHLLKDKEDYD